MPTHHASRRAGLGLPFVRPVTSFLSLMVNLLSETVWRDWQLAVGARMPGRAGAGSVMNKAGP